MFLMQEKRSIVSKHLYDRHKAKEIYGGTPPYGHPFITVFFFFFVPAKGQYIFLQGNPVNMANGYILKSQPV